MSYITCIRAYNKNEFREQVLIPEHSMTLLYSAINLIQDNTVLVLVFKVYYCYCLTPNRYSFVSSRAEFQLSSI